MIPSEPKDSLGYYFSCSLGWCALSKFFREVQFWINGPARQSQSNHYIFETTSIRCVLLYLKRSQILSNFRCFATIQRTSRRSHFFGVADSCGGGGGDNRLTFKQERRNELRFDSHAIQSLVEE